MSWTLVVVLCVNLPLLFLTGYRNIAILYSRTRQGERANSRIVFPTIPPKLRVSLGDFGGCSMSLFQRMWRPAATSMGQKASWRLSSSVSAPSKMRAAVIYQTGPADVIKYVEDYPVPNVANGHVLVQNEFAGINFIDTYHRSGLYPRELPFIGGQEGGGRIVATTPKAEADGFSVGDAVVYSVLGAYAEYAVRFLWRLLQWVFVAELVLRRRLL